MRSHDIVKSRNVLPATSELCVCAFVAFACIRLKQCRPLNAAIYNRNTLTHRSIAILAFIALFISIVWFLLFILMNQIITLSFFRWIRSNYHRIFLQNSQFVSRIKRNRYPIVGTLSSENIKNSRRRLCRLFCIKVHTTHAHSNAGLSVCECVPKYAPVLVLVFIVSTHVQKTRHHTHTWIQKDSSLCLHVGIRCSVRVVRHISHYHMQKKNRRYKCTVSISTKRKSWKWVV